MCQRFAAYGRMACMWPAIRPATILFDALFPVERYEIFVRMQGAAPARAGMDVWKGERTCL